MTDGKTDTQELMTVIEPTPDTPQEGATMPIEIPPGDEGLRQHVANLTMRVTVTEAKVESMGARIDRFMTPQQIEDIYQRISDETVGRVEVLLNGVTSHFGEIQFSAAQVTALDKTLQELVQASNERSKNNEFVSRALSSILGYDISNPTAPRIGLSIFEVMKQTDETAEKAVEEAEAARKAMEQVRYDSVQTLALAKQIADYHAKNEEALTAVAENAKRWKGVQDAIQKVISDPRILIPALGAFGGGGIAVARLIEALF